MKIFNLKQLFLYKKLLPTSLFLIFLVSLLFIPTYSARASFANSFAKAIAIASGEDITTGGGVINIISRAVNLIVAFITTITLFAIVWGGVMYILALGDETRVAKAKRILLYAIIGLIIVILAQAIIIAVVCVVQGDSTSFIIFPGGPPSCGDAEAEDFIIIIMRIIQFLMGPAAVIAFGALVYGGYLYIIAGPSGDEKKTSKGKQIVIYSFLGLAIIGISGILVNVVLSLVLPPVL